MTEIQGVDTSGDKIVKPHSSWFVLAKLAINSGHGGGVRLSGQEVEELANSPIIGLMMQAAREYGSATGDVNVPPCLREDAAFAPAAPVVDLAGLKPKVDGQVLLAAQQMDDAQRKQPEWLWHESDGYCTSYGRWKKDARQAPYIRADLIADLLTAAHRETVGEEEIARTILDRRGLGFYTDPMEGGQNAYDISCEALNEAEAILALFQAPRPGETGTQTQAARDVLAERRRQVEAEGWTPAHDEHNRCELATAAACYATAPSPVGIEREWVYPDPPKNWPWHRSWWKPSFYRRNLVKAGALILAEIERWDRAALLSAHRAEGETQA